MYRKYASALIQSWKQLEFELSTETGRDQNLSGDLSSNVSDCDDRLLEAAIQSGIATRSVTTNVSRQVVTENPLDRLRRGAIPPYLPVGDE